jgi:hypothetical protein
LARGRGAQSPAAPCVFTSGRPKKGARLRRDLGYGRVVARRGGKKSESRRRGRQMLTSVAVGSQFSSDKADRCIYECLHQCYVTRSPMWMPGLGLGMAGWAHARSEVENDDEPDRMLRTVSSIEPPLGALDRAKQHHRPKADLSDFVVLGSVELKLRRHPDIIMGGQSRRRIAWKARVA